jgi:hypothetical protein
MSELKDKAGELTDHVGDYLETMYKLTVLNATDKASGIASASITGIVVFILTIFAILFGSVGLGWWLGEKLDSMLAGFGIVAIVYVLMIVVILVLHKNHIFPLLRNFIIRKIYE